MLPRPSLPRPSLPAQVPSAPKHESKFVTQLADYVKEYEPKDEQTRLPHDLGPDGDNELPPFLQGLPRPPRVK